MKPGNSFEKDVQRVYSFLLNMRDEGVVVGNTVFMTGKSSVQHEIDVYYEFSKAGIRHRVAIECKDWASPVSKGQIQEFESKLRDIGSITGVVVSRNGFQRGADDFAKFNDILTLKFEELPSIKFLLGARLKTVALPDETYQGEPFWVIMEAKEGKVTGTHFATHFPDVDKMMIPLTYSHSHAQRVFDEANLDPTHWVIRGLPRFALRAFLITLEFYEKKMKGGAIICYIPPGAGPEGRIIGMPISRQELIREYYGKPISSIEGID